MAKKAVKKVVKKVVKKAAVKNEKKWIQKAIKHKGALHEELHVKEGKKIPLKKLEKASKTGGKEGERARLALTLEKITKKKPGKVIKKKVVAKGKK